MDSLVPANDLWAHSDCDRPVADCEHRAARPERPAGQNGLVTPDGRRDESNRESERCHGCDPTERPPSGATTCNAAGSTRRGRPSVRVHCGSLGHGSGTTPDRLSRSRGPCDSAVLGSGRPARSARAIRRRASSLPPRKRAADADSPPPSRVSPLESRERPARRPLQREVSGQSPAPRNPDRCRSCPVRHPALDSSLRPQMGARSQSREPCRLPRRRARSHEAAWRRFGREVARPAAPAKGDCSPRRCGPMPLGLLRHRRMPYPRHRPAWLLWPESRTLAATLAQAS